MQHFINPALGALYDSLILLIMPFLVFRCHEHILKVTTNLKSVFGSSWNINPSIFEGLKSAQASKQVVCFPLNTNIKLELKAHLKLQRTYLTFRTAVPFIMAR